MFGISHLARVSAELVIGQLGCQILNTGVPTDSGSCFILGKGNPHAAVGCRKGGPNLAFLLLNSATHI